VVRIHSPRPIFSITYEKSADFKPFCLESLRLPYRAVIAHQSLANVGMGNALLKNRLAPGGDAQRTLAGADN
jgi:hypothetical protein